MIIQETLESGLIKTTSDANKYLIQNETGLMYEEAIDVPNKYTYTESEEEIVHPELDGASEGNK